MIKQIAFAASLLAVNEANPMLDQLRKFSYLGSMVYSQLNTTLTAGEISKKIVSYGCYCFRDGNSGTDASFGSGRPVDAQDRLCSNLMKCRRCIQMDFGSDDSCDVHMEKYSYSIDTDSRLITCNNSDPCKQEKCECDKAFAEDLGKIWNDATFNEFYWNNNKNVRRRNKRNEETFDAEANCINNEESRLRANDCCGEIGRRMPYSTDRHDCCNNVQLVGIGQCFM